eukprot:1504279-Rhodomonas_salina.1
MASGFLVRMFQEHALVARCRGTASSCGLWPSDCGGGRREGEKEREGVGVRGRREERRDGAGEGKERRKERMVSEESQRQRQTDRQTQTHTHTDTQTHRHTDRHTGTNLEEAGGGHVAHDGHLRKSEAERDRQIDR